MAATRSRAIRLGLVCAASLLGPGPAAAAAAAGPALHGAEEALDRSVHLSWSDPSGVQAQGYELQRRPGGSANAEAWQAVALRDPLGRHFDDPIRTAGEYAYRVRGRYASGSSGDSGWSRWSAERRVSLPPSCRAPVDAGLARVSAHDRDADGDLDGRDLEQALRACSERGGCVLELLPETYDDVAILVSDGSPYPCTPSRTACLKLDFPRGLVIQGHGSSSVLRSPLWKTPYKPVPVLEFWNRPDIRLALRNLVLDGRKREQRAPKRGVNDMVSWWHYGFSNWNHWNDHSRRSRDGCIHNVQVRDFMMRGISLADVDGWVIEHSRIEDIGCHDDVTPCPKLELPAAFAPGYLSTGVGIHVDMYSDDLQIHHNRIERAVKYSLGFKHGADGLTTSIRRPRVWSNEISGTGSIGLFLAGLEDGWFSENLIERTDVGNEPPGMAVSYNTFGISCGGRVDGTSLEENRIHDAAGMAVNWQCSGSGNRFVRNRIEGSCRVKNPQRCVPGTRDCYDYPDVYVLRASGHLAFVDNEIRGSRCATPLRVQGGEDELVIEMRGGRFSKGPNTKEPVRFDRVAVLLSHDASFENLRLEFGPDTRGIVTDSVRVSPRRFLRRLTGSGVLVCAREPDACRRRCQGPSPPAWCAGLR